MNKKFELGDFMEGRLTSSFKILVLTSLMMSVWSTSVQSATDEAVPMTEASSEISDGSVSVNKSEQQSSGLETHEEKGSANESGSQEETDKSETSGSEPVQATEPNPQKSSQEPEKNGQTISEISSQELLERSKPLVEQADKFLFGEGVAPDVQKAKELYYEARKLGNTTAMKRLAAMYRRGLIGTADPVKAFELVLEAASLNDPSAQSELASLYLKGEGVLQSREKAKMWLEKSAGNGYVLANILLAEMLSDEQATPEEKQLAEEYLKKAETQSSPQNLYTISYAYARGARLPKNPEKAAYWAKLAAERGEPNAAYWLGGYLWQKGEVPEALQYFNKAADQGIEEAALVAGHIYKNGQGEQKPDVTMAIKRLEQAKELADEEDAFFMMKQYLFGPKSLRNKDSATRWLKAYTNKVDAAKLYELSDQYWNGKGVRRNFDLGGNFALAALKKQDMSGLCDYAVMLSSPNWHRRDYVSAYAVLDQCVLDMPGQKQWKELLDSLQSRMSEKEIQEAQSIDADEVVNKRILDTELRF